VVSEIRGWERLATMLLDLRLPIGLMFGLIGLLLVGYGLLGDPAVYAVSMGINVNVWSGAGMIVFAALMLAGVWKSARSRIPVA
jgi:hypothetical protein